MQLQDPQQHVAQEVNPVLEAFSQIAKTFGASVVKNLGSNKKGTTATAEVYVEGVREDDALAGIVRIRTNHRIGFRSYTLCSWENSIASFRLVSRGDEVRFTAGAKETCGGSAYYRGMRVNFTIMEMRGRSGDIEQLGKDAAARLVELGLWRVRDVRAAA